MTFEHLLDTDLCFHLLSLHFLSTTLHQTLTPLIWVGRGGWGQLGCCCPVSVWATSGSGLVQTGSTCKVHARYPAACGQRSRCERQRHADAHNEEVTWQSVWASCLKRLMPELRPKRSHCYFVVWFKSSKPFSCRTWNHAFSNLV